jgi:CubicO group peptidase (beta-lactamase class C family)
MARHRNLAAFRDQWDNYHSSNLVLGPDGPGVAFHAEASILSEPIYSQSFGKASVANGFDFTTSTVVNIKSIAKTFTEALVLKANELYGPILDNPIGNYSVIANNIARWENRFIPAASRSNAVTNPVWPVHTTATLRQIAGQTARIGGKRTSPATYEEEGTGEKRPLIRIQPYWFNGFGEYDGFDNLIAHNRVMTSLDSVDDIVAMAGAVLGGVEDPYNWTPAGAHDYLDAAGWLSAAICEELLGDSWYNLIQQQFDTLLGTPNSAYPSIGGNAQLAQYGSKWAAAFQGHNANPMEVANLATGYNSGPATSRNPFGLYLAPEQSTEFTYGTSGAAMNVVELATWAREMRWPTTANPYLTQSSIDEMFKNQTNGAADASEGAPWPRINWGFGTSRLQPVLSRDGVPLEVWGSQGHGGYGGSGGAVVWIEGTYYGPVRCVFAGASNTYLDYDDSYYTHEMRIYEMAKDFAASFLWG